MNSDFYNHTEGKILSLFYEIHKTNGTGYLCELVVEMLGFVVPNLTKGKRKKIAKILGT